MYVFSILLHYVNQYFWSILAVSISYLVYTWWSHPHKQFPPGVRGYPLVGALPYFGNYPERVIARWSREKYGAVMSVRFGMKDMVYINSYEMLSKAFIANSSKYVDRPDVPVMRKMLHNLGFAFRPADSKWKAQRNFAKNKLTRFGFANVDMEVRVNDIVEEVLLMVRNEKGKPFNFRSDVGWALCSSFIAFSFGRKYKENEEKMHRLMDNIFHLFSDIETAQTIHLTMMFPTLKVVPRFKTVLDGLYKRFSEMLEFVDGEISLRKESYIDGEVTDFVSAFWKEMKIRDDADGFSNEQLRMAIFEFIFAGTETSSLTILWGILCLLHYPDTQKKLVEEINSVIGKGEKPSMNHTSSLPYTMAFLQELYRYRTVSPFANQRMTNQTVQLGNYVIPKNTTVIPNLWAIHNDPDLWEKPELFKPERHLDEEGNFVYSKKIIPFSIGGRSCPGEKLGRMDIFLIFVNLVKNFEFLPDPESNELPDIDNAISGLMYSSLPFEVVAKPRE